VTVQASVGPIRGSEHGDPEDPLERRLGELVREWPELGAAADVYRATLPLLRSAGPIAAPIPLTEEQARRKLSKGEFLLHGAVFAFDRAAARDLMLRLTGALEEAGRIAVSPIRSALESDRLNPEELLGRALDGDYLFVSVRAEEQSLDASLLWTLARSALKPTLRVCCGDLTPLVHAARGWESACCFICGGTAALGELQGGEQAKHLRCGQCGADWLFRRLRCVYCANEDPSHLGVLYPEGRRENVRVEVCDKCHGYLKVVSRFAPCSPEELAVEDLATLYLDFLAQERGYMRSWRGGTGEQP
jgi:FdhE protein